MKICNSYHHQHIFGGTTELEEIIRIFNIDRCSTTFYPGSLMLHEHSNKFNNICKLIGLYNESYINSGLTFVEFCEDLGYGR